MSEPSSSKDAADGRDAARAPEPRWPAIIAIVVTGLVYASLPDYLSLGPRWLLIVLLGILEIPTVIFWRRGHGHVSRWLGYFVSGILTFFVVTSLVLLVMALPGRKETAIGLLQSAAALWVSNIFTFALWYWRLDGGGPSRRDRRAGHTEGAFLFPQMMLPGHRGKWSPWFIDYLFLAFCTGTAFSPTDVPILSRWAKVLVMVQSGISLSIVAMLVGRGINTL